MYDPRLIQKIETELSRAYRAGADGNPGRARVCARRAAGWAIGAYLRAQGGHQQSANAFDNIRYYAALPGLPEDVKQVLDHLTIKVVKDSIEDDSYYPLEDVDLITEAQWLSEKLLGISLTPEKP